MNSSLTILTACGSSLATKVLSAAPNGTIKKTNPKMSKLFYVETKQIHDIFSLADELTALANSPQSFVIRGEPLLGYSRPVRRLKYNSEDATATFRSNPVGERWVCFDFDKVPCHYKINAETMPGEALTYLSYLLPSEFHHTTFWAQWSSGAGINGWSHLSAHLWFMLDEPIHDDILNQWAKDSGSPIDPRVFNAVQPHFTASPILYGVPDPVKQRHGIVKGERDSTAIAL